MPNTNKEIKTIPKIIEPELNGKLNELVNTRSNHAATCMVLGMIIACTAPKTAIERMPVMINPL